MHACAGNDAAIGLYESIGFRQRARGREPAPALHA